MLVIVLSYIYEYYFCLIKNIMRFKGYYQREIPGCRISRSRSYCQGRTSPGSRRFAWGQI